MAELNTEPAECCAPAEQQSCCEPEAKADCCGHGDGCGCAAGRDEIGETVRARYAAATAAAESTGSGCCGAPAAIAGFRPDITSTDKHGNEVFGATL